MKLVTKQLETLIIVILHTLQNWNIIISTQIIQLQNFKEHLSNVGL